MSRRWRRFAARDSIECMKPVHRWVWSDGERRVRKLLAFGEVEGDGGRDILRAAEAHARSAATAALPRARDRRAAPRRSVPRSRRRAAAARATCRRRRSPRRAGCRTAITASTICASKTSRDDASARLPARRREGRRRPLRDLSRRRRRRPGDARDLRGDSPRRSVPHELHLHAARPRLAAALPAAGVARAREPVVEALPACRGGGGRRASAAPCSRSCISSCSPPFAWLAKRAERPRAGRLDADSHASGRRCRRRSQY